MINLSKQDQDKYSINEFSKSQSMNYLTNRILKQLPETVRSTKFFSHGITQVNPFVSEIAKRETAKYLAEQIYNNGSL